MNLQNCEEKNEHILVCLSSAPSNQKIIKTAAKMTEAFNAAFTAIYVETPDFSMSSESDKNRLRENMKFARKLGATVETVCGDDIAYQVAEFARLSGVTKIVIGKSAVLKRHFIRKPTLIEQLIEHAPNVDIHIIPDSTKITAYKPKHNPLQEISFSVYDLIISVSFLIISTLIGYLFSRLGFTEANIITVYILAVLLISILTKHRIYSLISSIVSVILFNFFFTAPHFTLRAYSSGYPATFAIMFISAFISSTLAIKLKSQAKQSAQAAFRTKILFDTNQLLQKADSKDTIIDETANQLIKLLGRGIVIYPVENNVLTSPVIYNADENKPLDMDLIKSEKNIAKWVLEHNHFAGASTENFGDAKEMYLSIRVNDNIYGVVGIDISGKPLDSFENSVMLSILGECGLTLENNKNAREKEEAAILAKNEQLRSNLLRSISHDLRTPLTSISGNADNLLSNGDAFSDKEKKQIYKDIYDDSMWLINLVENLLSITRIEDKGASLKFSSEVIDEIINEALNHINKRNTNHYINFCSSDEITLVNVDARLIVQVIINIVDNAIKYTPDGSEITISTKRKGDMLYVSIADNGKGIPDEEKEKVFDMFYAGATKIADSRRSIGLGLALCKSIISAHGGEIILTDNKPHGAVFTFSLPIKEIDINE